MPMWAEIAIGMLLGMSGGFIVFAIMHRLGGPSWREVMDYMAERLEFHADRMRFIREADKWHAERLSKSKHAERDRLLRLEE